MTTSNALQLVQLGQLVDNVAESAYKGLQNLGQTLSAMPDEDRKLALLLHLHSTRQRLLRLHVLIEWSNKAAATKEVGKVLAKARNHADSIRESADQLFYLNQELQASNVPVHDVHTARQVLQTGTFKLLPSVISDLCGPPKPNAGDRERALRFMNFVLRTKLLKETLPRGMRISSIGAGHTNVSFPGYYTAILTLAEAPVVQADQVSQPGHLEAGIGHPQPPLGPLTGPQQQPETGQPAGGPACTAAQTQEEPHQEKYRWRLLSFDLLPSFEREVLTPEQCSGLQSELEFQMWQAADLRAQHSMAAAQRAQQAQRGADTAQSGPSEVAPEPSQQPVSARVESSARVDSSQHSSHAQGSESQVPQPGSDTHGAPHPLQVLHNLLAGIAGRLVLHEVHGRLRQMLDDNGRWARLLKLNAAAVLSNGIRCSYWLNIQTSQTHAAKAREEEGGSSGKRPRPTSQPSGGSGPSPAPALEFGLTPDGAVTVIPVPLLPGHSASDSESLKLELRPAAMNVQDLLLQAAAQNAAVQLEALHHALQQQTSLTQSGCTLEVMANPKANLPNLAKPSATGLSQDSADGEPTSDVHQRSPAGLNQTALSGPKSPLLVMSSRGADLVVVSVQLKTGYLRISCGKGIAQDQEMLQLLKQAEDKLASLQREMRLTPLEDPTLPRGQALSQALAKQLSLLFLAVSQKACFAQLADVAQHHGLRMRRLPNGLLAGYMDQNPTAPILDPARCIALAFPPTPMLQPPPHPNVYRPWVNLGQPVSQPPTQSLAPTHKANSLSGFRSSVSQGQPVPFSSDPSAHRSKAASFSITHAPSQERQLPSQPLQTRFSSESATRQDDSTGLNPTSSAALRFCLLAQLTQTESSASWQCYLLMCSCTFRGILQKVLSCTPVPASPRESTGLRPQEPQASRAAPGLVLGDIVSWCQQEVVQQHLLAELQVLGIPWTEELVLRPRHHTPPDPTALPPNKRQKLHHDPGTDINTDASASPDSGMQDHRHEAQQAKLGKEAERASVGKVIEVQGVSLLRHLNGGNKPGSITIHIPSAEPAPGVWTADVHSAYLAELPSQLYTSSTPSLPASLSTSKMSALRNQHRQSETGAPSLSASPPAAGATTLSRQSPSQAAAAISNAGQCVSQHPHGMRVQSNLLQGATFTALLELVTGVDHMQSGLTRIHQLMQSQQQHLQQMSRHHQYAAAKLAQAKDLSAVKAEAETVLHYQDSAKADSAVGKVRTEERYSDGHQLGSDGQLASAMPVKSEDIDVVNASTSSASGRRQPPQPLAWHVVSSGVVQIAHVGLDHAVLEVRPPPPWSNATAPSVQPKSEEEATTDVADANDNPDTDMPDVQQLSVSPHQADAHNRLPTAEKLVTPPAPFLTIHIQWRLTVDQSPHQHSHHEPRLPSLATDAALKNGQPVFQGPSVSQGLPVSLGLPPLHPQQQPAGVAVDEAKHNTNATKSEGQGVPKLRCFIQSEPELPSQVLESFQDMADLGEEGLLLDALAVVAQPLVAVVGAISPEGCRAAGISPDQLTLCVKRPPYQIQLQFHQKDRPTVVSTLRFLKGRITFIDLSTLPAQLAQQTEGAAAAALLSQQAGLPEKLQSVLSEQGVFLPKGVSAELACSSEFFALAHQHKVSAGLWVHNSKLAAVLQHLVAQ